MEFVTAALLSCAYPGVILLCMEWSEQKHRVLTNSVAILTYPFGLAFVGLIASYSKNFRVTIRYVFGTGLVAVVLVLISSESLRWLLVKRKQKRLETTIERAVNWNNIQVPQELIETVQKECQHASTEIVQNENEISIIDLFKYKSLIVRFVIISFCWMSGTCIVYGVSIISVSLHGDRYLNFIIVGLGSVPSSLIIHFLLKYVGRRAGISICLLLSSIAIIATKLIPANMENVALMVFLIARIGSSVALSVMYIYTCELWPTSTRQTMISLSSTIARIGSATAPLVPLLANLSEILPFMVFALVALLASAFILLLPETNNRDLPDTIEKTIRLGEKQTTKPT